MAKLGSYKIGVVEESGAFGVEATKHPVEKGVSLTDHVQRELETFTISGKVVGTNAAKVEAYFKTQMNAGKPVVYIGKMRLSNVIILNFNKTHTSSVSNGFGFSMTLREVRIAKSSLVRKKTTAAGTQQKKPASQPKSKETYYIVKKGDTLWAIAKRYYGTPNYQKIFNANRGIIRNPNLIYPGQKFLIPK